MIDLKKNFHKIELPRFVEVKIQEVALSHLDLEDMGKLRDKYDAQAYFNKLRIDISSEFAFEKYLGLGDFDWERRKQKNYNRLEYKFFNKKIRLLTFSKEKKINLKESEICHHVLIYHKPDRNYFIGGIIFEENIKRLINESSNDSILGVQFEPDYEQMKKFENLEELEEVLKFID
ncbi:hypothetical protein [Cognataquiflexum rubidum]|uniref:hypothetical protein n=1 Tax=Cognataquiflexum rubidum TaxID=2922273 RepID=UPI001F1300CD|nr:hypothetical protein [Cognataquiflexum rubidum]MCH6236114.1 hypothetical protein [Cognataquiflexum rubidum]